MDAYCSVAGPKFPPVCLMNAGLLRQYNRVHGSHLFWKLAAVLHLLVHRYAFVPRHLRRQVTGFRPLHSFAPIVHMLIEGRFPDPVSSPFSSEWWRRRIG